MSRKISSRNDNQQRATQARAQQQHFEPKPRRARRMGAEPDLFGQGPAPEGRTPYDAAPAQAPGIAPLRMHPVLALTVLANVVLNGAHHALAPAQPTLPMLPTPEPTRQLAPEAPAAAAPTRKLLQTTPAISTAEALQQAAEDLRTAPCQAVESLATLGNDPAINATQVQQLSTSLRASVMQAAGVSPVATQSPYGANVYNMIRTGSGSDSYGYGYGNFYGEGGYYSAFYAKGMVADIDNRISQVNSAQLAVICATPENVGAARASLAQAWNTLHQVERNFWDWSQQSVRMADTFDSAANYTTEGTIPNATAIAALRSVPASFSLSDSAPFAQLFNAADALQSFEASRNATSWAQAGLALLNDSAPPSLFTSSGASLAMAPLTQQINGTLGGILASLQVSNATASAYSALDSGLLPALTRAQAATALLVGDDAHVDLLWNHANTTGASPSVLQNMQAARAAWQNVRTRELTLLSHGKPHQAAPQLPAVANATHNPASVAEGSIPLLRSDLLPEVINSSAATQQTFAQIRDGASLDTAAWQAVTDLAAEQPSLQDSLLFALGNLDAQAGASEGPQQHLMQAASLTEAAPRQLFAELTAPAHANAAVFAQGWQKLLAQSNLGQDMAGHKVRWSEWVGLVNDQNLQSSYRTNSTLFTSAMQAIGLPVRSQADLPYGSGAQLGAGDGSAVTYPALSALNQVQVSNTWRGATVYQLLNPWASTGVQRTPGYYSRGAATSDSSAQALATLLGLRLQTGQGDAYPAAYEALVGEPPASLQWVPTPPVVGVDDLLNSLWPEAKARVRYDASTQSWQTKPLSASWDSAQVRSATTLDGLQITSRNSRGKQHTQDLASWVKDAITLRCESYNTCSEDLTRY